jgi:hypothetical protein
LASYIVLDTPKTLTQDIHELCKTVSPATLPSYVPVVPEPYAVQNECYGNVAEKIRRDGGNLRYGWQIWERRHLFIEAEFHAVWLSRDGAMLDITPKDIPTKRILFLPDPTRRFEGKRVANIRRTLIDDPLLHDYLRLFTDHQQAVSALGGEGYFGPVTIKGTDYDRFERVQELEVQLARKYTKRNDPCGCGSGKKIKHCGCGYGKLLGLL